MRARRRTEASKFCMQIRCGIWGFDRASREGGEGYWVRTNAAGWAAALCPMGLAKEGNWGSTI